jgi:hypothetical protein
MKDKKSAKHPAADSAGEQTGGASAEFWKPDWRWHAKTLLSIYAALAVLYFVLSHLLARAPEPYRLRDIPAEMTPWLKK